MKNIPPELRPVLRSKNVIMLPAMWNQFQHVGEAIHHLVVEEGHTNIIMYGTNNAFLRDCSRSCIYETAHANGIECERNSATGHITYGGATVYGATPDSLHRVLPGREIDVLFYAWL